MNRIAPIVVFFILYSFLLTWREQIMWLDSMICMYVCMYVLYVCIVCMYCMYCMYVCNPFHGKINKNSTIRWYFLIRQNYLLDSILCYVFHHRLMVKRVNIYIYIYVCMHVCMYVCMYCMYVLYVCNVCMYVCMHVYMYVM